MSGQRQGAEPAPEIYRLMVETMPEFAILLLDPAGRIEVWNEGARRIFGYSADEVRGRHFALIFSERDQAKDVPQRELVRAAAEGKSADERWHIGKTGESYYLSGFTTPLHVPGSEDRLLGFVKIARDFTPEKKTETRISTHFRATKALTEEVTLAGAAPRLLRAICEGVEWDVGEMWLTDESGSQALFEHWQRPDLADTDFTPPRDRTTLVPGEGLVGRIWSNREAAWIPRLSEEPAFLRQNAAERAGLHSAFGFPIVCKEKVAGVCVFFSREARVPDKDFLNMALPLGEHIGLFIERERIGRSLEEANRAKEYLLARVSHDLRTPLTTIKGWALLLLSEKLDDRLRQGLEQIERSAYAQERLVHDLVDFSRVTAGGRISIDVRTVDLVSIARAAVSSLRLAASENAISITESWETSECPIEADPERLQQVLWNLLSNALKFTPEGGRIDVRVACTDREATLTVCDNGTGIEKELLPHIFEPYKQRSGATSGLGLGLAITREIVEAHGGTIHVKSGSSEGSTFVVTLPR